MNDYPAIQQFRIWSPEEKKYYYSGGTPSMLSSFFLQTATLHTVHKMPYQRGTFLHDKNGKEIYEGDIVSLNDGTKPMEVRWSRYFWELYSETQNAGLGLPNSLEVIGNIYENPDLLTKDKQP